MNKCQINITAKNRRRVRGRGELSVADKEELRLGDMARGVAAKLEEGNYKRCSSSFFASNSPETTRPFVTEAPTCSSRPSSATSSQYRWPVHHSWGVSSWTSPPVIPGRLLRGSRRSHCPASVGHDHHRRGQQPATILPHLSHKPHHCKWCTRVSPPHHLQWTSGSLEQERRRHLSNRCFIYSETFGG